VTIVPLKVVLSGSCRSNCKRSLLLYTKLYIPQLTVSDNTFRVPRSYADAAVDETYTSISHT
jgi:hypothetical protein